MFLLIDYLPNVPPPTIVIVRRAAFYIWPLASNAV